MSVRLSILGVWLDVCAGYVFDSRLAGNLEKVWECDTDLRLGLVILKLAFAWDIMNVDRLTVFLAPEMS